MIQIGNKEAAYITIGGKEVQKIEIGGKTAYEKVSVDYFYIENEYAGQNTLTLTTTISGSPSSSLYSDTVEYSKDKTNWITVTFDTTTPTTITMDQGDKVYFRNDNGKFNYEYSSNYYRTTFSASQNHSVGGNIMSLIDYTNIQGATLTTIGVFNCLFFRDSTLTDCSNLELPATTLTERCYKAMFQEATSLATTITTLPATTLAAQCYMSMYWGTAITTTNTLPATTLAAECYRNMYRGSHITTAPNLPATILAKGCYYSMLQDCTSLTTALPLPATTMLEDCYRGMYRGCTALRTAPVLYGTTLASNCYNAMFYGCSNLNSVTTYANGSGYGNATTNWLYNVYLIGTVYNNGTRTYTTNSYSGIPQGWTEVKPSSVDYFYIQNTYAGQNDITLETSESSLTPPANTHATSVEYSKDLTNWTTITFVTGSGNAQTITMNQGEKVYFRNSSGKFNYDSSANGSYHTSFKNSGSCVVGGDVRTLIDYNNYQTVTLPQGCFYQLFSGNTELTDASALKLPSTAIPDFGYKMMFNANLNLTAAPGIDATSVGEFGCDWMFKSCVSLQTAPELKSTVLSTGSYERMFQGCSLLNSVTIDANDISADFCLLNWLDGVASTGDFYNLGSATYPSGVSGIPTGWTEHTSL